MSALLTKPKIESIANTNNRLGETPLISVKLFDGLTSQQQKAMQDPADAAFKWSDAEYLKQETEIVPFFKEKGLNVYTPDVKAFQAYSNKKYLASSRSKSWPKGMLERVNAL